MVLQYAAASFHQTSVSTANINTVQYPKPYQQYEIPTVLDVDIQGAASSVQHHGSLSS